MFVCLFVRACVCVFVCVCGGGGWWGWGRFRMGRGGGGGGMGASFCFCSFLFFVCLFACLFLSGVVWVHFVIGVVILLWVFACLFLAFFFVCWEGALSKQVDSLLLYIVDLCYFVCYPLFNVWPVQCVRLCKQCIGVPRRWGGGGGGGGLGGVAQALEGRL